MRAIVAVVVKVVARLGQYAQLGQDREYGREHRREHKEGHREQQQRDPLVDGSWRGQSTANECRLLWVAARAFRAADIIVHDSHNQPNERVADDARFGEARLASSHAEVTNLGVDHGGASE